MSNSIKTVADSLALQITNPARDANLVEERVIDAEESDENKPRKEPTYRADIRVYAFDGHLLIVDVDRVDDSDIAELVSTAATATDSAFQAMNSSVQIKGHGYMVTLPPAKDAGFTDGDAAPVTTARNMLVVVHGDREAKNGTSTVAESLQTIRREQVRDWRN